MRSKPVAVQTLLITANAGVKAFPRMHSLEPAALDPLGSLRSQVLLLLLLA